MKTLSKALWRQTMVLIPFIILFVVITIVFQLSCHMTLNWHKQQTEIHDTYNLQFRIQSVSQPDSYYIKKNEIQPLFHSVYIESHDTPTRIFAYVNHPITKVLWGAEEAGAYRRSDTENMIIVQTIKDISSVYEFISGQLFIQDSSANRNEDCIHIAVSNRLAVRNGWKIDDVLEIEIPGLQAEAYDCQITDIFYNTADVAWMAENVAGEIIDNTVFVKWNELYPQFTEAEFDSLDDFITAETVFLVDDPENYDAMMTDLDQQGFSFDQYNVILTDDGYFEMMENLDQLQSTYHFLICIVGILLIVLFLYLLFIFTKKRLTEFKVFYGMGFSEKHIFKTIVHQLTVYALTGIVCASPIPLVLSIVLFEDGNLVSSALILCLTSVILLCIIGLYSALISRIMMRECKYGD